MNLKIFKKRLRYFYNNWINKQDQWENSDILLVSSPSSVDHNSVSQKFYVWLLGSIFTDMIILFTPKYIHIISNKEKLRQLKTLTDSVEEAFSLQLVLQEKSKSDDGFKIVEEIFSKLRTESRLKRLEVVKLMAKRNIELSVEDVKRRKLIVGHVGGESEKLLGYLLKKKGVEIVDVDITERLNRFALLGNIDGYLLNKKKFEERSEEETVVWGFKRSEREVGIYLRAFEEAEEEILLVEMEKEVGDFYMQAFKEADEEILLPEMEKEVGDFYMQAFKEAEEEICLPEIEKEVVDIYMQAFKDAEEEICLPEMEKEVVDFYMQAFNEAEEEIRSPHMEKELVDIYMHAFKVAEEEILLPEMEKEVDDSYMQAFKGSEKVTVVPVTSRL